MKEMREKAEKHVFQAEVNRMMKLIINSLYRNKEVRVVRAAVVLLLMLKRTNRLFFLLLKRQIFGFF